MKYFISLPRFIHQLTENCLQPAILTTMDITTDGFGFMLAVGDLSWVPFVYSLQARFLAFNHVELGPLYTSLIFAMNAAGYYIFRRANGEKDEFRKGNNPKSLSFSPFLIRMLSCMFRSEVYVNKKWL